MANVLKTKEELVDYLIEFLSYPHNIEIFRKNLMNEDVDIVLYILNELIDEDTNNILRNDD